MRAEVEDVEKLWVRTWSTIFLISWCRKPHLENTCGGHSETERNEWCHNRRQDGGSCHLGNGACNIYQR